MDPLTILVTALGTGAAEKLKPTAGKAIEDAYAGLKALLLRKFGNRQDVGDAVEKVEQKPDSEGRKTVLQEELEAAEAHKDEELLAAAKALLDKVKAQPGGEQRIKQIVKDSIGVAQAIDGTATVTLGNVPETK